MPGQLHSVSIKRHHRLVGVTRQDRQWQELAHSGAASSGPGIPGVFLAAETLTKTLCHTLSLNSVFASHTATGLCSRKYIFIRGNIKAI